MLSYLASRCVLIAGLCAGVALAAGPGSKSAKTDPDLAQREYMKEISRQLGVTCAHCHDVKNYKSTKLPTHAIAKTHMEVVALLNEKYSGKVGKKVDCYMCHRAQPKWDYKAPARLGEDTPLETDVGGSASGGH